MCLWCDVCACDLKVDALQSLDSYLPERLANALLKQSRKSIRNILIFISDWGKIASFQYKKNNVILIVMSMAIPVAEFQARGYSHLFNKRGGWNKRGGGAKNAKSQNVEVGINVEGGKI